MEVDTCLNIMYTWQKSIPIYWTQACVKNTIFLGVQEYMFGIMSSTEEWQCETSRMPTAFKFKLASRCWKNGIFHLSYLFRLNRAQGVIQQTQKTWVILSVDVDSSGIKVDNMTPVTCSHYYWKKLLLLKLDTCDWREHGG